MAWGYPENPETSISVSVDHIDHIMKVTSVVKSAGGSITRAVRESPSEAMALGSWTMGPVPGSLSGGGSVLHSNFLGMATPSQLENKHACEGIGTPLSTPCIYTAICF